MTRRSMKRNVSLVQTFVYWFFQQCPRGSPWCGIWLSGRHGSLHRLPWLNLREGKNTCVGLEIHSIGIPPLEIASDWRFGMYGLSGWLQNTEVPILFLFRSVSSTWQLPLFRVDAHPQDVRAKHGRQSSPFQSLDSLVWCSTDSTKYKRWKWAFICKKQRDEAH